MKTLLFSTLLLATNYAWAQNFCPTLETVTFSTDYCVPTQEETCHSGQPGNCEVQKQTVECTYVRGAGSFIMKNDLAPGFDCVDWEQDCGAPGENPGCQPGVCLKYSPPKCDQQCKDCALEIKKQYQPIRGCKKFCAEDSCADEPRCDPDPCKPGMPCNTNQVCAIKSIPDPAGGAPFILPAAKREACQNSQACPTSAMPPPGVTPQNCPSCEFNPDGTVKIKVTGVTSCTPKPITPDTSGVKNDACPWIDYEKRQPTCAPVTIGNRFPQDCKECNPPGTPNKKTCNITVDRCH